MFGRSLEEEASTTAKAGNEEWGSPGHTSHASPPLARLLIPLIQILIQILRVNWNPSASSPSPRDPSPHVWSSWVSGELGSPSSPPSMAVVVLCFLLSTTTSAMHSWRRRTCRGSGHRRTMWTGSTCRNAVQIKEKKSQESWPPSRTFPKHRRTPLSSELIYTYFIKHFIKNVDKTETISGALRWTGNISSKRVARALKVILFTY